MKLHLIGDLLTAAVAARVFGRDALAVLRRAAAAGVLMGLSELRVRRQGQGGEQ
ncbi:hypothetical protein OIU91_00275 [Streptomyces sp. NBC_01456]|uniref:hypothetical protein n=1 Tax=unclassified Streptomyces TaxID=2593676 RepID=UPI002E356C5E|nr:MULTISPECIES: hypothetical protein [unclassified Streptomyces]